MLRAFNERAAFELIRSGHPISRAEIARRTGLSKPTVSAALATLVAAGLVRETSPDLGRPTYGATFYEPVAEATHVLALDIGGRYLRGVVAALDGRPLARRDVDISGLRAEQVVTEIVGLRDRLVRLARIRPGDLEAAVAGIPGVIDRTGRVRLAAAVPDLAGLRIADRLGEALGLPVHAENDVNLAAIAEHEHGAGRGVQDFAFLSVGTGTGAGLVFDGRLHRGANGLAGEIDYAVDGEGRDPDASPHDPCAPVFLAVAERMVAEHVAAGGDTALAGLAGSPPAGTEPTDAAALTPERIFAAARAGDALAIRISAEEARRIAVYAAPIAAVADVELIVLGGGIGLNGDLLLEPLRTELARRHPYPPRVECSVLGDHAVLDGAVVAGLRIALERTVERRLSA
jgi:predicted NBD/HSP70 family sugar kinase